VPCEGSRIVHDGVEYRVSWSYIALGREVLDCPEWLLELVGKTRGMTGGSPGRPGGVGESAAGMRGLRCRKVSRRSSRHVSSKCCNRPIDRVNRAAVLVKVPGFAG